MHIVLDNRYYVSQLSCYRTNIFYVGRSVSQSVSGSVFATYDDHLTVLRNEDLQATNVTFAAHPDPNYRRWANEIIISSFYGQFNGSKREWRVSKCCH